MGSRPTTEILAAATLSATTIFGLGCASNDLDAEEEVSEALPERVFHTDGVEAHLSEGRAVRGKMFLAENEKRAGVKTRPSGLQFEVLEPGDGARPTVRDRVITHYKVSLVDGTVVDDSADYGEPVEFDVNKVIAGWREALQEMRVGAKWKLFVPPELAYGNQGMAQIPGGETLIYELELLGIKGGAQRESEPDVPLEALEPEPETPRKQAPPSPPRGDLSLDNLDLLD